MTETVFTFPGKIGDALHQWPVAFHWARQTQRRFTAWLDEKSLKPLVDLFESQPCVDKVELKPGIENYNCGGQPFHFDLDTKEFKGKKVYHLGLRGFPQVQLTQYCLGTANVPVTVSPDDLADIPSIIVEPQEKKRRVVLHGQAVYTHTRATPGFWKFIYANQSDLEARFDEIVFVGSPRDLEVASRTYPKWQTFDDGGSFKKLAEYVSASDLVIGTGSSVVVLPSLLKVPSIRVHDPIGEAPKAVWENIQRQHLNDTEGELRRTWPLFRDARFPAKVAA